MKYGIEVKVIIARYPDRFEWRRMKSARGAEYAWDTEAEAVRNRRMCYPDQTDDVVRVVEVPS